MTLKNIVFDSRWRGGNGIGRFSREIRSRLPSDTIDINGNDPVSLKGLLAIETEILKKRQLFRDRVFLSPGYAPPRTWYGPFIFTIHDLIHIDIPEEGSKFKSLYYDRVVLPGIHRAPKVFTDSEYSRNRILEWSGVKPSKIVIVSCGVGGEFSKEGDAYVPGYPYIFYVRNAKPHKNTLGLIRAFALIKDQDIRLLLSGEPEPDLQHEALRLGVFDRVIFAGRIPEEDLPAYYRGASVVTMPSFYEGFGLPPLEGMASGVPVVVANATSLPEVVGNAGLLVDPADPESIADGLERALTDTTLREVMIARGLERAQLFTWDRVGNRVRKELAELM